MLKKITYDESIVTHWMENPYLQDFTGEKAFQDLSRSHSSICGFCQFPPFSVTGIFIVVYPPITQSYPYSLLLQCYDLFSYTDLKLIVIQLKRNEQRSYSFFTLVLYSFWTRAQIID